MHEAYIRMKALQKHLNLFMPTSQSTADMLERLMTKLMKYIEFGTSIMDAYAVALTFDPRLKLFYVEKMFPDELQSVKDHIEKLYLTEYSQATVLDHVEETTVPMDDDMHSSSMHIFMEQMRTTVTTATTPLSELKRYLEEPLYIVGTGSTFNILQYWKDNEARFPTVARMAADFLGAPTSSVPSESTFSTSGSVVSDSRSNLKPHTVETLMCGESWEKASHRHNWDFLSRTKLD
jgi:hypothetical protein